MDHDPEESSADHLLEVEEAELSSEEDQPVSGNASASPSSAQSPRRDRVVAAGGGTRAKGHSSDDTERLDDGEEEDESGLHNVGPATIHDRQATAGGPAGDDGDDDAYNAEVENAEESSDPSDMEDDLADDDHEVMNGANDEEEDNLSSEDNLEEREYAHGEDANVNGEEDDDEEEDVGLTNDGPALDDDGDGDDADEYAHEGLSSRRAEQSRKEADGSSHDDGSDDSARGSDGGAIGGRADDEDEDPEQVVLRRPSRRTAPLKIPEELLQDGAYFRRSRRQRHAVSRYTVDVGGDSSDGHDANDSDFEAGEDDDDDDAGDGGDHDAADDSEEFKPKSKSRSKRVRRRPRRKQVVTQPATDDVVSAPHGVSEETSDSDGDWASRPSSSKRRGARRKPKRRARLARKSSEEEEITRTTRINARTGGVINYAEVGDSDSDIFDEVDAAANRAAKLEAASGVVDDGQPSIALVCDYRVPEQSDAAIVHHSGAPRRSAPFADFNPEAVEFYINWTGRSFRRNTWHKLEDLKSFKGFKKVTNYIKGVLTRRNELIQPGVTAEEHEEATMIFLENRKALEEYTVVERIVAERPAAEGDETEYLVKWQNLPYGDCTWEPSASLDSPADLKAIDAYTDRVQGSNSSGKARRFNPFGKEPREKFRKMKEQPKYLHGDGRTLREYQLAGLNWLAFSWSNSRNVILADEMGLGKTLQTIAILGWVMYQRHVHGPFLVVVPLSTIAAWVREFARWLPEMNVICYTGDARSRSIIREYEFEPPSGSRSRGNVVGFHTLLTTPELIMNDIEHLVPLRWAMIAVDEAHRLKNKDGELHRALSGLTSANRLLVTGTPLQNSVVELWALLHFLHPEFFDDASAFEEQFSFAALRDEVRVAHLHDTLRPYIIRRQKADVEKSLPQKTYSLLRVGMASEQQNLYRLLLTKNYAKLNVGKGKGMRPVATLRNLVMELKKCCNHPFLFDNVEDTTTGTSVETLIRASGKMILLDKLLLRLREKGHRVLVFSQMVRMLDILSDYCRMRGFLFQRLDGSMANDLRVRAVDHFNAPGSTDFMFLLSTRAGGLGINLATADTVIIFDSDWNPQNDLQAESRAHRIGQTKDVKVFRLVSRDTVEEDILERAKRKRVLEHLVIHGVEGDDQDKDGKMKFNKKELSAILRFGAEKLFKESNASGEDGSHQGTGGSPGENGNHIATPGDDAKAEEKRVMEIDDIDELLARTPAEPEEELGAAETNMGDSLLNAFKWADFDPVADDENEEGEITTAANESAAKDAAREISALDKKRKRDLAKAKARQEQEDADMAEEDADYWARVIPEDLKQDAALDEDIILGTRRRKRTKTYGSVESPEVDRQSKRSRRGVHGNGVSSEKKGELSRKEQRLLLRSWRKFGCLSRVDDILRDAALGGRIEVEKALGVLEDALKVARLELRKASASQAVAKHNDDMNDSAEPVSQVAGDGAEKPKSAGKSKGPPPVLVSVLGEQVNARELIRRVDELELLRRRIMQSSKGDLHFRLRRPIKAPAYGVPWKSKHDAMLLVGIHRHGLGNWVRIAADIELMLGDKITVPGSPEIKGAPDATKLARRAAALLRELVAEEKLASANGPKSGSLKAARSGRVPKIKPGSHVRGSKRERTDSGGTPLPSKRPRVKHEGKSSISKPESATRALSDRLKHSHLKVLKELRRLSGHNSSLDKSEIIRRTRDCLMDLGAEIVRLSEKKENHRAALWAFVHSTCRTHLPGERLALLYDKLIAERKRHASANN